MPVGGACSYCRVRRAVNRDHVIPKSKFRTHWWLWERLGYGPNDSWNLVPACFPCNMRKGTRLLVPSTFADRLDELNALGIGTFRVWRGDVESLREVVK